MRSRSDITGDLRALGVGAGDTVMVHASLRAVDEVAGGPDEVHLALKDVITPDGTLMMYAGCPRYFDEVGRGNLTADEEQEVLEKLPPFDAARARSARDHGALVELFRSYGDVEVNDHVARFVAWGRHAAAITAPHPDDFAYGHGTPLERFLQLAGKILLLGSDLDTVTFLHHTEHVVDIPDKRIVRFKVPVEQDGRRVWRELAEFDTSAGAHAAWPDRFFDAIVRQCLDESTNYGGRVGGAQSFLLPASRLHAVALRMMREAAAALTLLPPRLRSQVPDP
jgi:aminoglycoside 3-N-acetyltransferase